MTYEEERKALLDWSLQEEKRIEEKYKNSKVWENPQKRREHRALLEETGKRGRALDKKYGITYPARTAQSEE